MKIALISDIHGHYLALKAVLNQITAEAVDQIICLGDIVTIGPQPGETIAELRKLDCLTLLGNHEAALLHPEKAAQYHISPHLISTLHWCRNQLSAADFDHLRTFPSTADIPLDSETSLLCFHGSPTSNTDQILPTTADAIISQHFDQRPQQLFAGGHTHIQMVRQYQGKLLINPGSVGSAFPAPVFPNRPPDLLPWAEYAFITLQNDSLSVDLRRVPFDTAAFIEILQASDLPIKDWWLAQYS